MAIWVYIMIQIPGWVCFFIIDKDDHMAEKREEILKWLTTLYELYPNDCPKIKRRGAKVIELSNGAKILFESAMAPNPGTSEMINCLHRSERPKWPKGRSQQIKASIMPALPDQRFTISVDESTAEGPDEFKMDWDRLHREKEIGMIRTLALFFAWLTSSEYQTMPPDDCFTDGVFQYHNDDIELSEVDYEGNVVENEEQYAKHYNCNYKQIYWRRVTIKNKFEGDKNLFDQEYPTTPAHAWAAIGGTFIPTRLLKQVELFIKTPVFRGSIRHDPAAKSIGSFDLASAYDFKPILEARRDGTFQVARLPEPDVRYFLGGDVAEGKLCQIGVRSESDFSAIYVIDEYGRDCALWYDRIKPEELTFYLALIGSFYNFAMVNCERNKDGATVWAFFRKLGYPNIFYRERARGDIDDVAWSLIGPSERIPVLNITRVAMHEDPSRISFKELHTQASVLVRSKDKIEPVGEHDDIYLARCHAEIARRQLTDERFIPEHVVEEEIKFPQNCLRSLLDDEVYDLFDQERLEHEL
jgi:hypothetical protein